jgi:hypothetical protein
MFEKSMKNKRGHYNNILPSQCTIHYVCYLFFPFFFLIFFMFITSFDFVSLEKKMSWALVAHAYNPS